jgi:hypothetical protein
MREEAAVVYPASNVDSVVVSADMESASRLRHLLQAAGVLLPGELSASNDVGVSVRAMTGDQFLRKGRYVQRHFIANCSGRHRVRRIVKLLAHARNASSIDFSVTQGGIANPREFISQSACRLVVVGATAHQVPMLARN